MSRRSLTPAARGVSLAVLAALRAGRVDLADQADGSTLATSTAPDGTVLLHAVLHMPVRGHDPRQLTLPAVAPVPVPAEVPPAPVAVPAGEEREPEAPAPQGATRTEHNGLAVGDVVELDDEAFRVTVSDEYGWQGETVETSRSGRPLATVHCDWDDIQRVGPRAWYTRPSREKLRTVTDEGAPVSKGAAKPAAKAAKAAKARPARLTPEPEADALATPGTQAIVWQRAAGDPWELVWSSKTHGELTVSRAWELACEGHRARQYHRNGSCTRDSQDGAK